MYVPVVCFLCILERFYVRRSSLFLVGIVSRRCMLFHVRNFLGVISRVPVDPEKSRDCVFNA